VAVTPDPADDDTIRIHPPARRRGPGGAAPVALAVALVVGLVLGGLGTWALWPGPSAPPSAVSLPAVGLPAQAATPVATPVATPAPAAPQFGIQTADEATILAHVADQMTVFRFSADPQVIVLDFPSLHQQGLTLNRVAALIEKSGEPRDRVLTDAELNAAITTQGDTVDNYYYGHDYSVASLVRFFTLADQQHIALAPEENTLRALMRQLGWFAPNAVGGLISVPRANADPGVTENARATILHHELSHGIYFTDPAYAEHVTRFWHENLTEAEQAGVKTFLAKEGYDTTISELVQNEMQAYLFFTWDPQFFRSSDVGIDDTTRADLKAAFTRGLPDGWPKDVLTGR
jgi:hypothetical protein